MKNLVALLVLAVVSLPASGTDAGLYKHLESADFMRDKFLVKRSPTGIDFESKQRTNLAGRSHAQFHIEIEGALPVPGVASLDQAIEKIAAIVNPEVDAKHTEKNAIYPGLGVEVVDVNGANVAFFQYKSSREPDTFTRRALLYAKGHIYIVTMSLHSVPENDRMGMRVVMLVIAMVNSNEIPGLRT